MPDRDFTLPSGATHHVSMAPWSDAKALTKAIMRAAQGRDLSNLAAAFLQVAASDDVDKGVTVCLARSTRDGVKVTPDLFDDPKLGEEVRKDFVAMASNVVEVNCTPFFEQALSGLKARLGTGASAPAST